MWDITLKKPVKRKVGSMCGTSWCVCVGNTCNGVETGESKVT